MGTKRLLPLVATLLAFCICTLSASAQNKEFKQKVYGSSLRLYWLDLDGSDSLGTDLSSATSKCTAQIYEKIPHGYLLATASHCVVHTLTRGKEARDETAPDGSLFVSYGDPSASLVLHPVTVVLAGDADKGYDGAVLKWETDSDLPFVPLGDDTMLGVGDRVISVFAPLGGHIKYWFEGFFSSNGQQADTSVKGLEAFDFLQIGGTNGSSGAAIVSVDQQAIVGIFTGMVYNDEPMYERLCGTMLKISVFKELLAHPEGHIIPPPSQSKPAKK